MSATRFDVTAIGNAIVDIIGQCDDQYLAAIGTAKGSMRLVDAPTIEKIYSGAGPGIEVSGGSAANTAAGIASFGGRAAFIGTIATDDFGRVFAHDIAAAGVTFSTPAIDGAQPTSRSLILVTPDGERTMNTYLGVSTQFDESRLAPDLIVDSGILYLEGYLFDGDAAKAAFRAALGIAKKAGRQVALSLSDGFCVDRHRTEFLELIRSGVDVLFANEGEIKSLYQTSSFDEAAKMASRDTRLAALTRSGAGSVILANEASISVAAAPVAKVVDSTGAGDLFAAGFLYGLASAQPLETCGRLGSLAAAEIISHIGARPQASLAQLAKSADLI